MGRSLPLFSIKYLILLIIIGERSSGELAKLLNRSLSNTYRAMALLEEYALIQSVVKETKRWAIVKDNPFIKKLEQLLLLSQNNPEINNLLTISSSIQIGDFLFYRNGKTTTFEIKEVTHLSYTLILDILDRMVYLKLLKKELGRPNLFYPMDSDLARMFFHVCKEMKLVFSKKPEKMVLSLEETMGALTASDDILFLIRCDYLKEMVDILHDMDILGAVSNVHIYKKIKERFCPNRFNICILTKRAFYKLLRENPSAIASIPPEDIIKGEDVLKKVVNQKNFRQFFLNKKVREA